MHQAGGNASGLRWFYEGWAQYCRPVPAAVKTGNAPDLSLRGPNGAVAISGRHFQFVQSADKTYKPIASVAALTAQPLAALPPYGCGVPFTGSDRLAGWQCLQRKFIDATPSGLSFRGAKRRGNLPQRPTISPGPLCYPAVYCEIATSLRSSQ